MKTRPFSLFVISVTIFFFSCKTSPGDNAVAPGEDNPELVIKKLQQAVAAMPDSAGLRYLLMDELLRNNQFKLALHQNDTLLQGDSVNAGLWYRRGVIFLQDADTPRGIAALEKSVQHAPMFVEPLLQMAAVYAGQLNPKALDFADQVIRIAEDSRAVSQATFIKGLYYSNINKREQAIELFDTCIKNDYTFLEAYIEKGLLLYDQQNYAEAKQVFERALQVSNTFAEAYYQLGRCLEAMGNPAEAKLNYQKALGLDKQLAAAADALKRLG